MQKYWGEKYKKIDYSQMDQSIIKDFQGSHPKIILDWLSKNSYLYKVDPSYKLSNKEKKHRLMIKLEQVFGLELSKKHYKLV